MSEFPKSAGFIDFSQFHSALEDTALEYAFALACAAKAADLSA